MSMLTADLHIAEILYESGSVHFRYSRYLSQDGTRWIRHGSFVEYAENGKLQSEVNYEHGVEHGPCRDFYPSGSLAAEGNYVNGKEHGMWRFWSEDGHEENPVIYENGVEVA